WTLHHRTGSDRHHRLARQTPRRARRGSRLRRRQTVPPARRLPSAQCIARRTRGVFCLTRRSHDRRRDAPTVQNRPTSPHHSERRSELNNRSSTERSIMLSRASTEVIRATLPVVGAAIGDTTTLFYRKMFEAQPELERDLFNRGNQKQG